MIKYTICESFDAQRLIELVNGYISKGWEPVGGVSVTGEFHGIVMYSQALIRRK